MYTLSQIGFDSSFTGHLSDEELKDFSVGRIIAEFRERYWLISPAGEFVAEITGKIRFASVQREDFPAVGDFVLFVPFDDHQALIHEVLPRKNLLERKSVSSAVEKQIIAANIDYACIITASDRDFNLNRIDRYITLCYSAGIKPIILLSKSDLVTPEEIDRMKKEAGERHKNIPVYSFCSFDQNEIDQLTGIFEPQKTYCFLGSSGAGKSTLINQLTGADYFTTNVLSESTGKGKHTSTRRELIVLTTGAMVIDNPGMKEVGMTESDEGYEKAFEAITELSRKCRFSDCTHSGEPGCAVQKAIDEKKLDEKVLVSYRKIKNETIRLSSTIAEKRRKDKEFGKMAKAILKGKKETKF